MQYAKTGKKIYDKTQNIYWKPFKAINKKRVMKFNNVKCDAVYDTFQNSVVNVFYCSRMHID